MHGGETEDRGAGSSYARRADPSPRDGAGRTFASALSSEVYYCCLIVLPGVTGFTTGPVGSTGTTAAGGLYVHLHRGSTPPQVTSPSQFRTIPWQSADVFGGMQLHTPEVTSQLNSRATTGVVAADKAKAAKDNENAHITALRAWGAAEPEYKSNLPALHIGQSG